MRVKVDANLMPAPKIIERLGVGAKGRVQRYATERILFRMRRYMPWLTGETASQLTMVTSPTAITVNAPYAQYLYNGVSKSGNPLNYTDTTNQLAGPHWDRTLAQFEGAAIAQDIENYARTAK